jgi:hypothetical protein
VLISTTWRFPRRYAFGAAAFTSALAPAAWVSKLLLKRPASFFAVACGTRPKRLDFSYS